MIKRRAFELAEHMRILPRGPEDLEVAKMLETTGIKELKNPPTKIYITTNGGN